MILIMDEIEKLKDENNNLKQKLDDLKQIKKDEEFHKFSRLSHVSKVDNKKNN